MPRLKSRTKHPPHDFQLLLPEIGMKEPLKGSFDEMVQAFARIVRKNPAQAQRYNWPMDPKGQADFVDEREARRLVEHGWVEFVDFGGGMTGPIPPPPLKKNWRGVAAAIVSGGKAAFSGYNSMFGVGGKPVDRSVAEPRAQVCAACPQNDVKGGLGAYFVESAARSIMALMGALRDLSVVTTVNDKLGVCKVCKCPTAAKVFVPLENIEKNTPESMWPELPSNCWIKKEMGRL